MNVNATVKERLKYEDRYEDERGILLADQIDELCQNGLLISEGSYSRDNLRPASYTLRIGDEYVDSEGKRRSLTDDEGSFTFKKNSIIFVSTKEKLDLPFYIIGRFNLRVNWVYDGVLLGTGPQVDPGFSGHLSCPLYNLTNLDITIKRGQDFATIDFEKTTTLLRGMTFEQKKEWIAKSRDKEVREIDGRAHSFYLTPPMKPLQHRKTHEMVSSLFEMREELRNWRKLGIGAVISFFGLTLSLLGFSVNLYRQTAENARLSTETKMEVQSIREQLTKLERITQQIKSDPKPSDSSTTPIQPRKGKKSLR